MEDIWGKVLAGYNHPRPRMIFSEHVIPCFPVFSDFHGLIEFWSSSIQWFSGSTFHLASVAVGGKTGGSLSLWAQGTDIRQVFPAQHTFGSKEMSGRVRALLSQTHTHTHSHSLPRSSFLFFMVSWHYIPCFFYCTTVKKTQGLCVFLLFKKVISWPKKVSLDIFSNLPLFSWVLASFR